MTITRDQELWGSAQAIINLHGENAETYLAMRIGAAAQAGDAKAIAALKAIAERMDKLLRGGSPN